MTNETNTTVDVASDLEPAEEKSFSEQVRDFQLMFSYELHRLADLAGACSTFDMIMNDIGLPARYRYTEAGNTDEYTDYDYVGEDVLTPVESPEGAARWLRHTARALISATDQYGYREVYDPQRLNGSGGYVRLTEFLTEWGFPSKVDREVVIEGTFKVTMNVNGYEDDNLIDDVSIYNVANYVRSAIERSDSSVQWKARLPETDAS